MKDGLQDIKNGVAKISTWFGHLIDRLSSRKFLLTVAAGIPLVLNGQWGELVALVSVFIGAEGAGDAVQRYQETKNKGLTDEPPIHLGTTPGGSQTTFSDDEEDIDKDKIVHGNYPM